jgi:hypothetical protein
MTHPVLSRALRCTLATLPLLLACEAHDGEDSPPRAAEAPETAPTDARRIEFALEPGAATPEQIQAIATHLEGTMKVHDARVEVRQHTDDATTVAIEIRGSGFPTDDAIVADLRKSFPALTNALIDVKATDPDARARPIELPEIDKDADPEEVEKKIVDELRARGEKGEIVVDVEDEDDGKRKVEVKVERKELGEAAH